MRRISTAISGIAIALLAVMASPALAQETTRDRNPADRDLDRTNRAAAGQLDSVTRGANVRASKLIGMNIQNEQGKSVGEINDLVLDGNSGRVRYAAVTYGGFLGIGNKMFAVPFEAFKVRQERGDPDDYVLVLNVTQQQLEGAVGFDEDHWPNFADQKFTAELDKRYGVTRPMRDRSGRVNIEADRDSVDINVDREPKNK